VKPENTDRALAAGELRGVAFLVFARLRRRTQLQENDHATHEDRDEISHRHAQDHRTVAAAGPMAWPSRHRRTD